MTIRVYGTLLYATGAWGSEEGGSVTSAVALTPDHIDGWMLNCASHGVTGVLWQSNCGGTSTHPSPVFPLAGPPHPPHNEHWTEVWEYLGRQVCRFDTLALAVAAAHRHGLRLVYSFCVCDFVDSPFEDSLFHPHLWVRSRRGEPFHGVPCFAEPEAQDILLAHAIDVLDHGIDDLAISFFSHLSSQGVDQANYYGCNPPALAAYRQRSGDDPLLSGIGEESWRSLHGDFYTEFIRRLHAETSARGQRLIPCATRDGHWGWGGTGGKQLTGRYFNYGPAPTASPAFALELQWHRWADEGLADALLLVDTVADASAVKEQSRLPVVLWRHTSPLTVDDHWERCRADAGEVAEGALDGFAAHAMVLVDLDGYLDKLWALMRAASPD